MKNWTIRIGSPEDIARIKGNVEKILSQRGVKIDHPVVLPALLKAGATQGADGRVCFPIPMQREYLAMAPKAFILGGMEDKYNIHFPHPTGEFYARGPIGQMFYLDPLTGEHRENTMAEQLDYVKVQQGLNNISMWGNFTVKCDDFPTETMDIHTAALCMKHCKKPAYWMPYSAHSVKYVVELAQLIAGGSKELSKRPFLTLQSASASPLGINFMDCEQLLQAAIHNLPIHCASLPCAGSNAPITPEGLTLLSMCETISQALVAQVLLPGVPVMLSAFSYSSDMRNMNTLIAGTEEHLSRLLTCQVIMDGYGLPCHTFNGGTNSHTLDGQAIADDAMSTHLMGLTGATLMGDLGALESGMIASPLQLIIDNDLVTMAQRLQAGVDVDDERMATDTIMELEVGQAFLDQDHTLDHFHEVIYPKTFNRQSRTTWEEQGQKDIIDNAREVYKKIIADHKPAEHSQEVLREMDAIVARADRELGK